MKQILKDLSQGSRIAFVRDFRSMSQDEVADKLGLKGKDRRKTISRYENGEFTPQPNRLLEIANKLNWNEDTVSEEIIDTFVENITVCNDRFEWKLNSLNDTMNMDNDTIIFLTRIIVTKDDIERFMENHKEIGKIRIKKPVIIDLYLKIPR